MRFAWPLFFVFLHSSAKSITISARRNEVSGCRAIVEFADSCGACWLAKNTCQLLLKYLHRLPVLVFAVGCPIEVRTERELRVTQAAQTGP